MDNYERIQKTQGSHHPPIAEAYLVPSESSMPLSTMTSSTPDVGSIRDYLSRRSWPAGLQQSLINSLANISMRYFICDDSGSMTSNDGHRLVESNPTPRLVSCSRWSEMTESLRFHVGLASAAKSASEFRLLNGACPMRVGNSNQEDEVNVPLLLALFDGSPSGGTPLCFQVNQVVNHITSIAPTLRATGKKAAIIIMTDGEASDGAIIDAMRPLEKLPVWVVIRLCTDEDKMVTYWNNVDSDLELSMDVIDDHLGEAKEIHSVNSWLTYGEPLHRLREFGVTAKEMDLIDEASLSKEQMKHMIALLFGVPARELPEPALDWVAFSQRIHDLNNSTPMVWNPITKRMSKWVDMAALTRAYGPRSGECACSMS